MGRETLDPEALLRDNENLREQQRALSNVLRAVARSEGLDSVFQAVVEAAARLSDADYGEVHLADGDVFRLAATHGAESAMYEYDRDHPHLRDRTSCVGRVALSGEVVHIPDVVADPEYSWPGQGLAGYHAMLGAPITVDEALIGVISLLRYAPQPFSDDQIELLRTFADQAAIAIANARLIDAVERQLDQQRAISDVLRSVARSEKLETVFENVIEEAKTLCHAEFGALFLTDGDLLRFASGDKGEPALERFDREHPHARDRRTAVGRVALTGEIVHIPDVRADPEYDWGGAELAEYRTVLAAPILVDNEFIGTVDVARGVVDPFSEEEIQLLRTFADQAAIAIANARLLDAVERQRTELSRFVSPQVASLLSSDDGERLLAGHRAYISVLFCDLRGFTAFAETAAPEELFELLRDYHALIGELISVHEGTLEHFAGDGVMVFFNDPSPIEDHEAKAIRMALALRERFGELAAVWRKRGTELDVGIGMASGYATLGRIGFEGRYDYGALGPVTNLASRLSTNAGSGQILISQRLLAAVEDVVDAQPVGELELKGFRQPVHAYEVRGIR
jgi:class 3 adenylate cyclase/putative methionine-R-sulfoxide reductase with GAF domain